MFRIGLDAGHGGTNKGTSKWGLVEKDINIAIAEMVRDEIIKRQDMRVTMVRMGDETLGLGNRRLRASHCDFVLCLHVNAIYKRTIHGAECYYQHGNALSKKIGELILSGMPVELKTSRSVDAYDNPDREDDNWKEAPQNVLCHGLCALIEMGYASNPEDCERLTSPSYQRRIANSLAACIFEAGDLIKSTERKDDAKCGNEATQKAGREVEVDLRPDVGGIPQRGGDGEAGQARRGRGEARETPTGSDRQGRDSPGKPKGE